MKTDNNTVIGPATAETNLKDMSPSWTGGGTDQRVGHRRTRLDLTTYPGPWTISEDTREVLENCELFQDISTPQLMEVAALVEEESLRTDDMLLWEGQAARYMFVIVQGTAVAHVKTQRRWISLGLVGPGETADWSALLDWPFFYPASVRALTPMRVGRIDTSGLMVLMHQDPSIGYPVHRRLSAIFYRQYQASLNALKTPR